MFLICDLFTIFFSFLEEFEDTKGVIRIGKSKKNRQYNGQTKALEVVERYEENKLYNNLVDYTFPIVNYAFKFCNIPATRMLF